MYRTFTTSKRNGYVPGKALRQLNQKKEDRVHGSSLIWLLKNLTWPEREHSRKVCDETLPKVSRKKEKQEERFLRTSEPNLSLLGFFKQTNRWSWLNKDKKLTYKHNNVIKGSDKYISSYKAQLASAFINGDSITNFPDPKSWLMITLGKTKNICHTQSIVHYLKTMSCLKYYFFFKF